MTTFADNETCERHGVRLSWVDHGSPRICHECRAEAASQDRITAAQSTSDRVDAVLGFGWRPRRQREEWHQ